MRVPLDQVITEIGTIEAELTKKVEALRVDVDAEATAGRLAPPLAESLRWSLRLALPSAGVDFSSLISASRLPTENTKIMDAVKKLEAEWTAGQQKRNALLQSALTEARARTGEVAHTATKVGDIDPLLAMLDRLQEAQQGRAIPVAPSSNTNSFSSLSSFLRTLRRVIETGAQGDAISLGSALTQLQNSTYSIRGVISDADIQERVQNGIAPFQKAIEDAQAALDNGLAEKKPSAELTANLTRYEDAVERFQQVRSSLNIRLRDNASVPGIYRNLVGIVTAMQNNDFAQARALMSSARGSNLQPLGAVRSSAYAAQIAEWEKALNDQKLEIANKRRQALAERLNAIKTPADLEALASELAASASNSSSRREEQDDWPRNLGSQLNALAALWNGTNPQLVRQGFQDSSDARFAMELNKLRQRIERDILARTLNAPELLKPPLADLSTDESLDKLSAQLSANRDWRRLLQLTNARMTQNQFMPSNSADLDLAGALRAFIAGQNMELAEQWADAVQSYKSVLRCTNERAPTRDAAERLKALTKSHPEAFPPATAIPAPHPPNVRVLPEQ
jgi:hypothetical protein